MVELFTSLQTGRYIGPVVLPLEAAVAFAHRPDPGGADDGNGFVYSGDRRDARILADLIKDGRSIPEVWFGRRDRLTGCCATAQ